MPVRHLATLFIFAVVTTTPFDAGATPPLEDLAETARRQGSLRFALQAFTQIYDEKERPSALLGIARCHHDRYDETGAADAHALAIAHYQAFLATRPLPRSAAAVRTSVARLRSEEVAPLSREPSPSPPASWIAVTSPTPNARARIDGGASRRTPFFVRATPGRHRIIISGRHHLPRRRVVSVAEGRLEHVHLPLKARPAELTVSTDAGARLLVDGAFVAQAPFDEPLSLPPGRHIIDVALHGHRTEQTEVRLRPGTRHDVAIDLSPTPQRYGALTLFAVGAAGIAASIGFGVASALNDTAAGQASVQSERDRLEGLADDHRLGAALAAGGGFVTWIAGGALFLFDETPVELAPGPGLMGAALSARF